MTEQEAARNAARDTVDFSDPLAVDEVYDPDMLKLLQQPPAKGWQPNPGDMMTGTCIEIDDADAGGFGVYPLLTIEKDNGEVVAVHCFHEVLKTRVQSLIDRGKLVEGSRVGIVYQGKTAGGNFGGYENYRFIVRTPPPVQPS